MHRDLNDFELLYLVNNNCFAAVKTMLEKYNPLVWKTVYSFINSHLPKGVEKNDLYQEGRIAFYESCFTYKTNLDVPYYSFTKLCIERRMMGYLRRFRSEASRLFYNSLSLDMSVTEDNNVYLHEMISEDLQDLSAFKQYAEEINSLIIENKDLSQFEKQVLLLKIFGYSYSEMSKILDCSAKRVDNTLQKVKRLLA